MISTQKISVKKVTPVKIGPKKLEGSVKPNPVNTD
jgi:hypothetical protein